MNDEKRKEQRKNKRRPILESFSVFAVIPQKGAHRLSLHDLSEGGLAFDLDAEGESAADFVVSNGDFLNIELYLNQTLRVPLRVKVVRIQGQEQEGSRFVGAEFVDQDTPNHRALISFLQLLDQLTDVAKI